MTKDDLSNPILNSPYAPPAAYFEIGTKGPTGKVLDGRRLSESFIPVPASRKGRTDQQALDFDATGERLEANGLINDIRREVELWRANNWTGVTPYTRKLLSHWAARPPERDDPVLFCQREAAETAVFLAEVAGRHGTADYRRRLEPENASHNDGLPRVGLKMATGTGKTVVMAMLISWQTINKVMTPRDARFAKRFLVVTPGITIRDRLGVLHPEREENYYRQRDLVPPDLWGALGQAQIAIVNYHVLLPRDAKEIQGVAANTRKLLRGGKPDAADAFRETPDMVAARVLRRFGAGKGEVIVFNDEAHHCYQDMPAGDSDDGPEREDQERNREARVWFRGLCDVRRKAGIKTVYDLSATPYYLKGTGYGEGFIFPWVVSDFSLMDAIESGIVKIPRIPVDDDAAGKEVVYLNLWDHIQPPLPRRRSKRISTRARKGGCPRRRSRALFEASTAATSRTTRVTRRSSRSSASRRPSSSWSVRTRSCRSCCSNGSPAAKWSSTTAKRLVKGELGLFSNIKDGEWVARQRTILVDSAQLESGEPLGGDFKKVAAHGDRGLQAGLQAPQPRR